MRRSNSVLRGVVGSWASCGRRWASSADAAKAWEMPMQIEEFETMRTVLAAPSPVGLENAMVVELQKYMSPATQRGWAVHRFKGSAAMVVDTDAQDKSGKPICMVMGHTDKIRMQVRKIADDGKVYIDSDSHLPLTLLGNAVTIFAEDEENLGMYRKIEGGTVEALGAIHFADPALRTGTKGISPESLYVELQLHGEKRKDQVTKQLGIKVGDSILMDRPIQRGVGHNSFQGAYLDNGLGCFVTAKTANLVADRCSDDPAFLDKVRVMFAFAPHEEIGRFGSRVLANVLRPDVLLAVDVNHDYNAAPGVSAKNFPDIAMGRGPTLAVGSIVSPHLNRIVRESAKRAGIPLQLDVVGRDTGTDAMAGVLSSIDCACTSIGIPIRNMHTISETGCTTDVTAAAHLAFETICHISEHGFHAEHPNLSLASPLRLE